MPSHTSCRICRTALPPPFFDLGMMPLANAFHAAPRDPATEPRFPLALTACGACGLVQLNFTVPASTLYRDYIYVSSTSEAVRAHGRTLAANMAERCGLTGTDLIVEIASNDGTVLKAFQDRGLRVLGVEPARNIAALAEDAGVPTIAEFFDGNLARTIETSHGRAAVVLARHVFAHVDDVHDFLDGATRVLTEDGVLAIEVPYLGDLLANREFDTIYHEHLSYFGLSQFVRLCDDHGLHLAHVDRIGLHGGSVVVHIRRRSGQPSDAVVSMLEEERQHSLWADDTLRGFVRDIRLWTEEFESLVDRLVREGAVLVGYGAAAKANTLLNHCPSVARALECILDRSPHKQGRFTPGTSTPVRPVDDESLDRATHMVILAWNFKDEIMRQMSAFAARGGRFVVPLPTLAIV